MDIENPISPQNPLELRTRKTLVGLLTSHQRRVLAYIHTLIPNPHDAEDIYQETCEVICEKFDTFEQGTDFLAWACQIAWWRVRAARKKFAQSKVVFNDDVLDLLSEAARYTAAEVDARQDALVGCLALLPQRDRELILTRYERGMSVPLAAARSGRSVEAAYKALTRIRMMLLQCVNRKLSTGPLAGGAV